MNKHSKYAAQFEVAAKANQTTAQTTLEATTIIRGT